MRAWCALYHTHILVVFHIIFQILYFYTLLAYYLIVLSTRVSTNHTLQVRFIWFIRLMILTSFHRSKNCLHPFLFMFLVTYLCRYRKNFLFHFSFVKLFWQWYCWRTDQKVFLLRHNIRVFIFLYWSSFELAKPVGEFWKIGLPVFRVPFVLERKNKKPLS